MSSGSLAVINAPALGEFEPSDNQLKALAIVKQADYSIGAIELSKQVGITNQAYYDWFNKPGFDEWWLAQAASHFKRKLPEVLKATMLAATTPAGRQEPKLNPAAIKLALERFDPDYRPSSSIDIDLHVSFDQVLGSLEQAARDELE